MKDEEEPRIFHILHGDALEVSYTPFGSVGKIFSGEGIEAVWVSKHDEAIDPEWFSQPKVDIIVVVKGQLCVEFEKQSLSSQILDPGDVLVLPPYTACRAYRWPQERKEPTIFLAVYPVE